ncbi:MAG: NfeD family protein [Bacteroidota bacterium]|nr:NfeD family protein [Bacteroidota bacterium]
MSLTAIIFLIVLGIILFFIEFLIVPGVTIAGIAGAILIFIGIYFGYKEYGTPTGHYILLATAGVSIFSVVFMLRVGTWEKLMLNSKIESKTSATLEKEVNIGDVGETVTRLNPYGKVFLNEKYYEAKSLSSYIDPKTKIEVKKIERSYIIVKPLN